MPVVLTLDGNVLRLAGDSARGRVGHRDPRAHARGSQRRRALTPDDVALAARETLAVETPRAHPQDAVHHAARQGDPPADGRPAPRSWKPSKRNTLTFGIGPAGTGKTFLAIVMAVRALRARRVSRIILSRPAVEAGEKLGFLPGDLKEKVDPYLRPLYDALGELLDDGVVAKFVERGTIEVAPLAYMRGRTLSDAFVILDEAQNATREQLKMFLTRLGTGLEDGRQRRRHADRPAARRPFAACRTRRGSSRASTTSASSS